MPFEVFFKIEFADFGERDNRRHGFGIDREQRLGEQPFDRHAQLRGL